MSRGLCIGPRVVGLTGPAGAGKTTAARMMADFGYRTVSFAAPLKRAFGAILEAGGISPANVERMISGDLKEEPIDILGGRSPRYAMQTLGTEWGRDRMDADFWVALARNRITILLAEGHHVVIDDVRFLNEAIAVHDLGGRLWRLTGRGGIAGAHASERQDFAVDLEIDNGGISRALLRGKIEEAVMRPG